MKLLSKNEAQSKKKSENDAFVESNIRLREREKQLVGRLNNLKSNYEPEKILALRDYELYMADLIEKKSKALRELTAIQNMVNDKKEMYYRLLEREDELLEKAYLVAEKEKKLELREKFVEETEKKIYDKRP